MDRAAKKEAAEGSRATRSIVYQGKGIPRNWSLFYERRLGKHTRLPKGPLSYTNIDQEKMHFWAAPRRPFPNDPAVGQKGGQIRKRTFDPLVGGQGKSPGALAAIAFPSDTAEILISDLRKPGTYGNRGQAPRQKAFRGANPCFPEMQIAGGAPAPKSVQYLRGQMKEAGW